MCCPVQEHGEPQTPLGLPEMVIAGSMENPRLHSVPQKRLQQVEVALGGGVGSPVSTEAVSVLGSLEE